MTFTLGFALGFAIGWLVLKRPQWADDAWQWLKHKIRPDKSVT